MSDVLFFALTHTVCVPVGVFGGVIIGLAAKDARERPETKLRGIEDYYDHDVPDDHWKVYEGEHV